jgi:nucleoside 2-deoxyribosyltransferase
VTASKDWAEHARRELAPKMASSAYVITINPDDIDPKIALETGYAILLDKPIVLLVPVGKRVNPGLRRIATKVVELRSPLDTDAGQQQLMAALATMNSGGGS